MTTFSRTPPKLSRCRHTAQLMLSASLLTLIAILLMVALVPAQAQSLPGQPAAHLEFPAASPGIPAYARLELLISEFDVPNNDDWAAIVFYRKPECVPHDFDLGRFFHPPGPNGLGAFACELLIEGHELWENGPDSDLAPIYVRSRNATPGLPIWFVAWAELEPLLDRGQVFIDEIENLPSLLRGQARWFEEALYPNGAAVDPAITIRAEGRIEGGGRFRLGWHFQASIGADDVEIDLEFSDPPHAGPPRLCELKPHLPFC